MTREGCPATAFRGSRPSFIYEYGSGYIGEKENTK